MQKKSKMEIQDNFFAQEWTDGMCVVRGVEGGGGADYQKAVSESSSSSDNLP